MERETARRDEERPEKKVRFRVASARSGRVLREVFREDASEDSTDSDTAATSESERAISPVTSEANSHLSALAGAEPDESGVEPDELLAYASIAKEQLFSGKRVVIFSKNGTVRGVRDKVSAGQVLYNNLAKLYGGGLHGNRPKRL